MLRRNTGVNSSVNSSSSFVRAVKTVNPVNEYIIKPPFKSVKKRAGESVENRNLPVNPINAKPFSTNF